jgi:hypothetical protein
VALDVGSGAASTVSPMANLAPQLASIATALDELNARLGVLAEEQHRAKAEETAVELDEIERSLRAGVRRLERLVHALRT